MQLEREKPLRQTISALTAALIGVAPSIATAQGHSEASLLIYSESERVKATEAYFSLSKELHGNKIFGIRLTFDGLTGSSPTGESPSKRAQTITRSSGSARVVIPAGALPTRTFSDTRFSADLSLERPLTPGIDLNVGGHASSEHDYTSLGLNAALTHELNNNKTTVGISGAYSRDVVAPVNGSPTPFGSTVAEEEDNNQRRLQTGSPKRVIDLVASVTHVLAPQTIIRLNYSFTRSAGYLTDPYKLISVVQPLEGIDPGEPVDALHERRPQTRIGNALATEGRFRVIGATNSVMYRFYWDDWGLTSHTVDLLWSFSIHTLGEFRPRARWYSQQRADFSRPFLIENAPLPEYASADARLAMFTSLTYGLTHIIPFGKSSRFTSSLEFYSQRGDSSPPESFGPLVAFNLFPDLDAFMFRIGVIRDF